MTLQELYVDESKWNKFFLAMDKDGDDVNIYDENAYSWCLLGGVMKCYGIANMSPILNKIRDYVAIYGIPGVITYNNHPNVTFKEIRKLVEDLNI